jgi:DNA-binding XRE family transcriptional regulator
MVHFFAVKTEKCKFHIDLWAFFLILFFFLASCTTSKPSPKEQEIYQAIGEKIRTERIKRGMTQAELSAAVGMSQNSLSLIEDGLATPIEHKIEAIEDYMGIDLIDFDTLNPLSN